MYSDQVKDEKSDGNAINEYINMNSKPVEIRYFLWFRLFFTTMF